MSEPRIKKRSLRMIYSSSEGEEEVEKVYKFNILLPNATACLMSFRKPASYEMSVKTFVNKVKTEYYAHFQREIAKQKKAVKWESDDVYLEDALGNTIRSKVCFLNFKPHKIHILKLVDGSGVSVEKYENMWDLTPDTDLLTELPAEYTYEAALAELIDNSLQAVWSNDENERRLISIKVDADKITVLDTGPGMDDSDENSIVKWGKMGASLHRSSRELATGSKLKPPYLLPFFGMFGYGGAIASMHLGRWAIVSSKRKESKKVFTLHLQREALLNSSSSGRTWRTDGGIRDPVTDDTEMSPHGSFTKVLDQGSEFIFCDVSQPIICAQLGVILTVEILKPKMKSLNISQLQCRLKDIYFPYIQYDDLSAKGRTMTPVEFEVDGVNLAEVEGGEVATTNLHSSNGPDFVLHLLFKRNRQETTTKTEGLKAYDTARARLRCMYFPIIEGKESIEKILEQLEADGCGIKESLKTFSRVSVRRLGRLLPETRWSCLPFMELKQKKGDRAHILKRCSSRVKCFIETDAGFSPTRSKTDLILHDSFTMALKTFGSKASDMEKEVNVDIYNEDGKLLGLSQLDKCYQEWILKMHDSYDEEINRGEDQAVLIVNSGKRSAGMSSDVYRVYEKIRRKDKLWTRGEKIKVLKGACMGCHKNNVYGTLEYILVEGFQGDAGAEAQLICRPIHVPDDKGSVLKEKDGSPIWDIGASVAIPISVIDSGKCVSMGSDEWNDQLRKQNQKAPATIDLLNMDEALPIDDPVTAGHVPPSELVAVVRPASFSSTSAKCLEQKFIIKDNFEMLLEVKFSADKSDPKDVGKKDPKDIRHIYSNRATSTSRDGILGFYVFPLGSRFPKLFHKAGLYTFTFSVKSSRMRTFERRVRVVALSEASTWGLLREKQIPNFEIRVGSCCPPVSIVCYDSYENSIPFTCFPEVTVRLKYNSNIFENVSKMNVALSSNKMILTVKDIIVECQELEKKSTDFRATLMIYSPDEKFSIAIPCQVSPGALHHVKIQPENLGDQLRPGCVLKKIVLEAFDAFRNHVGEGLEVKVDVDGFAFQDKIGSSRKVGDCGCIDLSGILRVTAGYGQNASLSVKLEDKVVFEQQYHTVKRFLRIASKVPEFCFAGSKLENVVFEIIDAEGNIDHTIHDEISQSHTLSVKSGSLGSDDSVRYAFSGGRCVIPAISFPQTEGSFCFTAAHSSFPEIHTSVKINLLRAPKEEFQLSNDQSLVLLNSPAVTDIVQAVITKEKELESGLLKSAARVGDCEKRLKVFIKEKEDIELTMSELQASMELELYDNLYDNSEKAMLIDTIEGKHDSAASLICSLMRRHSTQEPKLSFIEDIVGIVALLGTVRSCELSKVLAEYLGEDHMVAIVCQTGATAAFLDKFNEDGNEDSFTMGFGRPIKGRFVVICLGDIRPYSGGCTDGDHLDLRDPTLPNSEVPSGFLGYAVNMVDIDVNHLKIRTNTGHGLRETLFYGLFGNLQVYVTKEHMKLASPCITDGAVSLDGGIVRRNGFISLGDREPGFLFPVITDETRVQLSLENTVIMKLIEEKKEELREKNKQIASLSQFHEKAKKKVSKKKDRYAKFLKEQSPLMKDYYLLEN